MRVRFISILCIVFLLTGCKNTNLTIENAIELRERISKSNGCTFRSTVTADYGEKFYTFSMDCTADKEGNMTFTVNEPATLTGITGKIDTSGGGITFDDKVLAFQTIADGQITPVTAPWLFLKTLRSGYLRDCSNTEKGYRISIDDSYEADALRLNIFVENEYPVSAEFFWKGRRVLTITVENFTYL